MTGKLILLTVLFSCGVTQSYPLTSNDVFLGELNDRPIIAVLAQAIEGFKEYSYIAASYVKYLESAGARVVPILESFDQEEVEKIFQFVNGVLFPGGSTKWFESSYYKNAAKAVEISIKAGQSGKDYFPIWGTCLGYEALNVIIANSQEVLSNFAANGISLPLNFTDNANSSNLYKNCPSIIYKAMETEDITYNHHSFGVSPQTHTTNKKINDFFKMLSTSKDTNGKYFVSLIEGNIVGTKYCRCH